jgi:hypothetical protein
VNHMDDRIEPLVRTVLIDEARIVAPASLHETVAGFDARRGAGRLDRVRGAVDIPVLRSVPGLGVVPVIVAMVAIVAIAGGGLVVRDSLGAGGSRGDASPVSWSTPYASLVAEDFRINAGPGVFRGVTAPELNSDPGWSTYCTLEVTWQEQGVEMRLYVYFAADERDWWVSEMRTYDGRSPGEWVYYEGPLFRTPLGESFRGDVDLSSTSSRSPSVPGQLHLRGLTLAAFSPLRATGTQPPNDGSAAPGGGPISGTQPANVVVEASAVPALGGPTAAPEASKGSR